MGSSSIQNFESPDSDPFIEFTPDKTGDLPYSYSIRLLSVGESLFLLRSTSDFGEICRRFKDRDLRSTVFELFAARLFNNAEFEIHVRPEINKKGEDFDFQVSRSGTTINCRSDGAYSARCVLEDYT
jgi:hypothetical protein